MIDRFTKLWCSRCVKTVSVPSRSIAFSRDSQWACPECGTIYSLSAGGLDPGFLEESVVDLYNKTEWWTNRPKSNSGEAEAFLSVMGQAYLTWCRKHDSYGSSNISTFGLKGILVRVWDKVQRLLRLVWLNKTNTLTDETLEDTWIDIAVYCFIAVLVMRGEWPKSPMDIES